ncbi:hypothetical protein [Paraburkholderia phosphatilytica]|uniref:hypothetical protein n=1 Tax=Paraburkholderia phosphatilytica TaxID=2282883 RepID=UPI000F5FF63C|nr:hypothetical protein [Paraburkholderia phosphatilytica]
MPSWENESPNARAAATYIAEKVIANKATPEWLSLVFPDGDDVAQRVLLGVFAAAIPVVVEDTPESDEERAERLALEKRNRIVSPRVTEREAPGECKTISPTL